MKILRILLILLVPAMGIVGCQKSTTRPACGNKANAQPTETSTNPAGRSGDVMTPIVEGADIYGSGDDDRDGGDKKKR